MIRSQDEKKQFKTKLRANIHTFDSLLGNIGNSGVVFHYEQPSINPVAFRVTGATIFDFPDYALSSVYYICSDLNFSSNPSYFCGSRNDIIHVVPRLGLIGPAYNYSTDCPHVVLGGQQLTNINFSLRDQNFNLVKNARFSITIIFYVC